jgi:replication-associated recombination protein RarA
LFVDEVHRFNKSQQDAMLPWVENGTVILIGATTENPYFEDELRVAFLAVGLVVEMDEERALTQMHITPALIDRW